MRLGGPFLRDYFLSRTEAVHAARTIPALARCASAMRPVRHFSDAQTTAISGTANYMSHAALAGEEVLLQPRACAPFLNIP